MIISKMLFTNLENILKADVIEIDTLKLKIQKFLCSKKKKVNN